MLCVRRVLRKGWRAGRGRPGGSPLGYCPCRALRPALGQLRSLSPLPHYDGQMGSEDPSVFCHTVVGSGQWGSFSTLAHSMGRWAAGIPKYIASPYGKVGSGAPSVHCHTAWGSGQRGSFSALQGPWVGRILQYTASLHGAMGSGALAVHYFTSWGHGQRGSCSTLHHCRG